MMLRNAPNVKWKMENDFDYTRIAGAVGVRERVELGGDDSAYARKLRGVYLRHVHEFVQAEQMQQLPEHQQINLRVVRELSRFDFLVGGELRDLPARKFALHDLPEN